MHIVRDPLSRSDRCAQVAIVGIGNHSRGDDAAGLEVALRLGDLDGDSVAVRTHRGEALGLIELIEHAGAALLIDAVRSGAPPGTLHEHDVSAEPLPVGLSRGSTHAFGVADSIELARRLGRLPATVIVFGLEGRRWELGAPMSEPVARSIPMLAVAIRECALRLGSGAHP